MKPVLGLAVASVLFVCAVSASAHHIWLEPDGGALRLCYGEFGENLRETSPGLLDRLAPQAKSISATGNQSLAPAKGATCFAVPATPKAGDSVVAEDARYPISVRTRDGVTSRSTWWPAARFVTDRAARAPELTLDIVPLGGATFRVFFKGRLLAKAKVEVVAAFGWSKELRTDDNGDFDVALPWRGAYVFEVQHADRMAGKRGEEAYDTASYVTTLSLVQADGLDMPPLPPPAKPN